MHQGSSTQTMYDVGGVIPTDATDLNFLNGVLNSPVANFCFQRMAKPFRGGFLSSANKQFIAPLPVPDANDSQKAESISKLAEDLQEKHNSSEGLR